MIDKIFELSELTDTTVFYGVNNSNVHLIKTLHPNVRFSARGGIIKLAGNEEDINNLYSTLEKLERYCIDNNTLSEENIIEIVKGNVPNEIKFEHLILHGVNGKSIMARTTNQQKLVKDFDTNDLLFAIGPAGSGKTYTAIALAVRSLKNREIKKIILSRPAVEAGEKLGFLPGDMKEKIDPYLQPLYDALSDMITPLKLKEYLENGTIQIAPLAFMRGRTLNDAFIILDEAQNTTTEQIKMFLTRVGFGSTAVITGDITQIDLPSEKISGLRHVLDVLKDIEGISFTFFGSRDVVRHPLVQRIVSAYEAYEQKIKPI